MVSSLPRRLELLPCRKYAALLLLAHAAAGACLLAILAGWPGPVAALLMVALGSAAAWDRALLGAAGSPRAIEILPSSQAQCILRGGAAVPVRPLGRAGVTRYWVALGLRSPARRALFVPACMMSAESARLLRLWALWGKLPGVAPGQLRA